MLSARSFAEGGAHGVLILGRAGKGLVLLLGRRPLNRMREATHGASPVRRLNPGAPEYDCQAVFFPEPAADPRNLRRPGCGVGSSSCRRRDRPSGSRVDLGSLAIQEAEDSHSNKDVTLLEASASAHLERSASIELYEESRQESGVE